RDRTAERFVDAPGIGRCYRTGDLARRRSDGTLVLLGREDGQVKLHGYRIELGQVQSGRLEHPGVAQCVVLPVPTGGRVDGLEAWIVRAAGTLDVQRLE